MEHTVKLSLLDKLNNMVYLSDMGTDQICILYFIILNQALFQKIVEQRYLKQWNYIINGVCERGYMYVMKNLYFNGLSGVISLQFNEFLSTCFKNGHLEMAQWLYSNTSDDTLILYNTHFINASTKGHLDIMEWLWSLNKINIHDVDYYTFYNSCRNGRLDIAKWIYQLNDKINLNGNYNDFFITACINGHIDFAKWLYSLDGEIDTHLNSASVFKQTCNCGQLEIAKWLYSIYGNIDIKIIIDRLNDRRANFYPPYVHIMEWLSSLF